MSSDIKTIVFSANRACQLELLLRSLNFPVTVFYNFDSKFETGYRKVLEMYPEHEYIKQINFKKQLADIVRGTKFISFLCDDCVMVEHYDQNSKEINEFKNDPEVVSFSLGLSSDVVGKKWNWKDYGGNYRLRMWGFPVSVDSCILRSEDILPIINNTEFNSLNILEVNFTKNIPPRPKMMCFDSRKIVNYFVNTVQTDFKRHTNGPTVEELEKRFLQGERISLEDVKEKTKNARLYRVRENFTFEQNPPQAINDLRSLDIVQKRRIWKPFMEKYNCQTICELGVYEGGNFDLMIEHAPKEAVAIDAWLNDGVASHNDLGETQEVLDKRYFNFISRMKKKPNVKVYKEYTSDAVRHFPDNYFDLIYIDADHSYESCLRDITDWFPKVKPGKFLTGDDYRNGFTNRTKVKFGVIEAVNNFAKLNHLTVYEIPRYGWAIIRLKE